MTTKNEVSNLNKDQLAAAHSQGKIILSVSPPGSGKTSTAAERIRWLVQDQNYDASSIIAVTFTNSGARALVSKTGGIKLGFCGTLHALCLRLLKCYAQQVRLPENITVLDEEEAHQRLLDIAKELRLDDKISETQLEAALEKVRRLPLAMLHNTPSQTIVADKAEVVAREYFRRQRETGELDYDSILKYGHSLITRQPSLLPWEHLIADEFQDAGPYDAYIYHAMLCASKFFIGDDAQAIYGFRGAEVKHIIHMSKCDGITLCPLHINYRSGLAIVAATQHLISFNASRIPNPSIAHRSGGTVSVQAHDNPGNELATIANVLISCEGTAAVLWRTNKAAAQCREYLQGLGIKVATQRAEKQDAAARAGRAALCFMANPWSDSAALRWLKADTKTDVSKLQAKADAEMCSVAGMVNAFVCDIDVNGEWDLAGFTKLLDKNLGFGLLSHQWLLALAATMPDTFTLSDLMAASVARTEETEGEGITVGTYHSVKGKEYALVICAGAEAETWDKPENIEESRRLFYVGCTRAEDTLIVSWCKTRPALGRVWLQEPRTRSRFIGELGID